MRKTLSGLHCTESSAEAVQELQPGHYLCLLAGVSFQCRLFLSLFAPRPLSPCWSLLLEVTLGFHNRGHSEPPAEGWSHPAACCAWCCGPERAAPEARG